MLNDEQTWLRCYIAGEECMKLMKAETLSDIYGPEKMIIDIPIGQKDKWINKCYRMDEVRLYSTTFWLYINNHVKNYTDFESDELKRYIDELCK